jgi:hypothetical protein
MVALEAKVQVLVVSPKLSNQSYAGLASISAGSQAGTPS